MSWSPVATANFYVRGNLNRIPPPPRISNIRNPTVRGGPVQPSSSTDVSPPSCPLSRTSSASSGVASDSNSGPSPSLFLRPLRRYDLFVFSRSLRCFLAVSWAPTLRHPPSQSKSTNISNLISATTYNHDRHVWPGALGAGHECVLLGLDVCRRWHMGYAAQYVLAAEPAGLEL